MTGILAVQPTPTWYLLLSAAIFAIGVFGVLVRRNPLVMFMCIELMLNAANLSFVAFADMLGNQPACMLDTSAEICTVARCDKGEFHRRSKT